ncbi:MAG: hypothetical protein DCC75_09780, partial [Proteobacteria bacterium]
MTVGVCDNSRVDVYLVRHGIAAPRGSRLFANDDRPLTVKGKRKLHEISRALTKLVPRPDLILSSPLIRARETAEIVGAAWGFKKRVACNQALLPEREAEEIAEILNRHKSKKDIVLVGHEPNRSAVACWLLRSEHGSLERKKGSVCRITVNGTRNRPSGQLRWLLTP